MDQLLKLLSTGKPAAEATLCRQMDITETELNERLTALETLGYRFLRKGGLRLAPAPGSLLPGDILIELHASRLGRGEILYAPQMGSTNTELKNAAQTRVLPHGSLAICDRQTQGKGRLNRVWEASGMGEALAVSLLLRPELTPERTPLLTLAVAIAAAEAIESFGPRTGIKWPNDVVIGSRKCVGILCETLTDPAGERCVVAGAGFNVNQREFSNELSGKATSLFMETGRFVERRMLLCRYLERLEPILQGLENGETDAFFSRYAARSVTLGKRVEVIGASERFMGIALRVDDMGALWVQPDGAGEPKRVLSGDVSVRGVMGYV